MRQQANESGSAGSEIQLMEEMLKFVIHMRMKTVKMTQEAVQIYQPEVIQKIEVFKQAEDSNDLKTALKEDSGDEILTFDEINEKVFVFKMEN